MDRNPLIATESRSARDWHQLLLQLIVLIALPLLVLGGLFNCEFLRWDDTRTTATNTQLLEPPLKQIPRFFVELDDDQTNLYIPLTKTFWLLIGHLARLDTSRANGRANGRADGILFDPRYFHAVSLLVHSLNTLLVFGLLKRLTGLGWPSVIGALVFALHPLQVESVAWVSGQKDLFAATGELVALSAFVRFLDFHKNVRRRAAWYACGLIAFVLAMFAKASAVACPLLALLLGIVIVDRQFWFRRVLLPLLPWTLLALPFVAEGRHLQPLDTGPRIALLLRPLVAGDALAFYLGKLLIPMQLAADYGRRPDLFLASTAAHWTWIVPSAAAIALAFFGRRVGWLCTGMLFFIAALLPVLGFLPFQAQRVSTVTDHYVYLAMFGIALAVTAITHRLVRNAMAQIVVAASLLTLCIISFVQTSYWQNSLIFFTHVLDVNPRSYMSMAVLGEIAREGGRPEIAEQYFRTSLQVRPDYGPALYHLGTLLLREGRYPEAVGKLEGAQEIMPDYADARNNLGVALLAVGKPKEAMVQLRVALRLKPGSANTESNLGRASLALGDRASAIEHFRRALQIDPALPSALRGLQECGE